MDNINTSLTVSKRMPQAGEFETHFGEGPQLRLFACEGQLAHSMLTFGIVYRHFTGDDAVRTYLIDGSKSEREAQELVDAAIHQCACVVAIEERSDFAIAPHIRNLLSAGIPTWVGLRGDRSAQDVDAIAQIYDEVCNPPDSEACETQGCKLTYSTLATDAACHTGCCVIAGALQAMRLPCESH